MPAPPTTSVVAVATKAVAVTVEKPRSTKGRILAKRDATKDAKEPNEPAAPTAKERKEKKAAEEKKAEEDAEEESAEGEKKKKRKGGGHSGSRDHPSFEEIIRECIRESKEDRREGVSRPTIKSRFSLLAPTFPSFRLSPWPPPFPAAVRSMVGGGPKGAGPIRFGTSGALTRLFDC